jgi:putative sugar O-methyltransferase
VTDDHRARVVAETRAFYRRVAALDVSAADGYPLTDLWGRQNMAVLSSIIDRIDDPLAQLAAIQDTPLFGFATADDELKSLMVNWYVDYLRRRGHPLDTLPAGCEESSFSNPRNTVVREGRRLSPDFLLTVAYALEILDHCRLAEGRIAVLELGAGYGGLARTLRLFRPDLTTVIVDIPETLYFSTLFLRLNFPEARVAYVTERGALDGDLRGYDLVFVPSVLARELSGREFELFCNTASLGEMRNDVIRYWMDLVERRVRVRYFFGVNRFLNTMRPWRDAYRVDENACSVSFDAAWKILYWELEPPLSRCPWLLTEVTRNLEVVAERLADEPSPAECEAASRRLADSIARHDWLVHYGEDNTMFLRDNVLAPDLTQTGPLFALWESIRLHPSPRNVTMMLKYLNTLTRGKPFEEMYHYEALLRSWGQEAPVPQPPRLTATPLGRVLRRMAPNWARRPWRRFRGRE